MSHRRSSAFTLIEVLIVVVIMAILAGAIVPQMLNSSKDAKEALLRDHLRILRTQIEMFKAQHMGKVPGGFFLNQLTKATDVAGNLSPTGQPTDTYPYGPYLKAIPAQPFSATQTVVQINSGGPVPVAAPGNGWIYHQVTGQIWVNHVDYVTW